MTRMVKMLFVALMVSLVVPVFALNETQFAATLEAAGNANQYLYSIMEPGMPKHSPEFQAALAAQKTTREAIAREITALDTKAELEQADAVAKAFAELPGADREIVRLTKSLIASRLQFIEAHQS